MSENVVGFIDWKKRAEKGEYTFNQFDLFDRVVNIKFICGDKSNPDEYVIRSDYEIYKPDLIKGMTQGESESSSPCVIRKCRIKPSIKVIYKQKAQNTPVAIDIYIKNFFILTKDGQTLLSFSNKGYPLHSIEVQLGYFGQFAHMYKNRENRVPTKEEFFAMEAPLGVQTLLCNTAYTQIDKLPPDSTLHIHAFVGDLTNKPVKDYIEVEEKKKEVDYEIAGESEEFRFKNFAHYIFNNITRRFVRMQSPNILNKIGILDGVKKDKNGLMNYVKAQMYGVKVFLSEGIVNSYTMQGKSVVYDSEGNAVKGSSFFTQSLSGSTLSKALNTIVKKINPKIRISPASNGDCFLFLDGEDENKLAKGDTYWYIYERGNGSGVDIDGDGKVSWRELELRRYKMRDIVAYLHESMLSTGVALGDSIALAKMDEDKEYVRKEATTIQEGEGVRLSKIEMDFTNKALPAVYDINIDSLCTIVCPFFWFLNPFDTVRFQTRYALGGLVSYFADFTPKENKFTVLWQNVSFSTDENINECEIVCTGEEAKENE